MVNMNIGLNVTAERVIKLVAITVAVIVGVFIFYKLLAYFAPFVIAYILSLIIEPIIIFATRKLRIHRKLAAPVSILLILSILGFLLFLIISKLIIEIGDMTKLLPEFFNNLYTHILVLISNARNQFDWIPSGITTDLGSMISGMSNTLTSILNTIIKGAFSTAISLPEILIFIIITILSTYFLTSDRERIYGFFRKQLPENWSKKFYSLKNDMFSALFGYIKAQLILMSITFT
jgi:predicted PurR-regulated permease PerM